MKNLPVIGCLLMMLFLSACGFGIPGGDSGSASIVPDKSEAPVVTVPSAPPENTLPPVVQEDAPEASSPAQVSNTGNAVDEVPQNAKASPVREAEPSAPAAENQSVQASDQNQPPASEPFTGVMGTEFVVPAGFIQLSESPNIGYQYTFWHPDYEIRIEVSEIAPGYLPEDAWELDRSNASNDPDVTYFKEGEAWFVESGYRNNGEEIFYAKESSADGGLKSFRITYPTAKREFGVSIRAEFESNCRF